MHTDPPPSPASPDPSDCPLGAGRRTIVTEGSTGVATSDLSHREHDGSQPTNSRVGDRKPRPDAIPRQSGIVDAPCGHTARFPGFPEFQSNVTYVPYQFFTVVMPYRSRGCVRLVGYLLRHTLGWVDTDGNPTREKLEFSYRELIERAGISRDEIKGAIAEAVHHRLVECVAEPRPAMAGQPARSGVYRLRWSKGFTNSPDEFQGFCSGEAVPVIADGEPIHAVSARKNIPNAFFDYVLRNERLSVARVVGVMLFRTIRWTTSGQRRLPVAISISELCRLTHMTRRHVHEAVQSALRAGYIECAQPGRFGGHGDGEATRAVYQIRWSASNPVPTVVPPGQPQASTPPARAADSFPFSDRSEREHSDAVRNGAQPRSEMDNDEGSEKGNGISSKTSIKNLTATAPVPTARSSRTPVAAEEGGIEQKLVAAGLDRRTAKDLLARHPAEVIHQQLEWLPLRTAHRSRQGMLRRAIEGNWSRPEVQAGPPPNEAGSLFARHYSAARDEVRVIPASCTPKEAAKAGEFLEQLASVILGAPDPAEMGRRFGRFVRSKNAPKPWLVWAIGVYGAEFIGRYRDRSRQASGASLHEARRAHESLFADQYQAYLRDAECRCQREQPELYDAFLAHRADINSKLRLSDATRARLASEPSRLSAFAEFMRGRGTPLLEFWEWDRQLNARPSATPAVDGRTST